MKSKHKTVALCWLWSALGLVMLMACLTACMRNGRPDGRPREIVPVREATDGRSIKLTPVAEFSLPAPPRDFAFADDDNVLYVFLNREGVSIFDLTVPQSPRIIGRLDEREAHPDLAPHYFINGWVDGDRLIVVNRHHGLVVYGIGDPRHPRYLASHPLPTNETMKGLRVGDDFLIPAGSYGIYRTPADLSQTDAPDRLLQHVDYVKEVKLYPPHWLLVADDYDYGLQVIDMADPNAPRLATAFNTGNHCDQVEVFDGFVVINNRSRGIMILSMERPGEPFLLSYLLTARGIGVRAICKLSEDRLAVGYNSGCLDVIDVKNPRQPLWLARVPVGADINCITSCGDTLFVGLNNPPWELSDRTSHQLKLYRLEEEGGR